MTKPLRGETAIPGDLEGLLQELHDLMREMDEAYRQTASSFGFSCEACTDSCCLSVFHHHTFLELLLLEQGLRELPVGRRETIRERAARYEKDRADGKRSPCPLLEGTACSLYPFRPMICRLHGLPSVHRHPAKGSVSGPGCHKFDREHPEPHLPPLDRTLFYSRLAALEKEARRIGGISSVPPRTVAELILQVLGNPSPR